jgi:hypothetical protein
MHAVAACKHASAGITGALMGYVEWICIIFKTTSAMAGFDFLYQVLGFYNATPAPAFRARRRAGPWLLPWQRRSGTWSTQGHSLRRRRYDS